MHPGPKVAWDSPCFATFLGALQRMATALERSIWLRRACLAVVKKRMLITYVFSFGYLELGPKVHLLVPGVWCSGSDRLAGDQSARARGQASFLVMWDPLLNDKSWDSGNSHSFSLGLEHGPDVGQC